MRKFLTAVRVLTVAALCLGIPALAHAQPWASTGDTRPFTANGSLPLEVRGMGVASIQVSGTFSATVSFEVRNDPTLAWAPITCGSLLQDTGAATSTTTAGIWVCPVGGVGYLQAT